MKRKQKSDLKLRIKDAEKALEWLYLAREIRVWYSMGNTYQEISKQMNIAYSRVLKAKRIGELYKIGEDNGNKKERQLLKEIKELKEVLAENS